MSEDIPSADEFKEQEGVESSAGDIPSVEEFKEAERVEISIDEEDITAEEGKVQADVSAAFRDLGRQFAETLQTAWNSQERREFESEVREGVQLFASEVQKVFREAKESPAAKKVKEEAQEVRERVEKEDLTRKARGSVVDGLQWLSQELGRLAEQFSPPEKAPTPEEEEIEIEEES